MTYEVEGQLSFFDLDTEFTKMFQEPCPPTMEKTSGSSLKKCAKSKMKMPMFLDLRTGSGSLAGPSWETDIALLGESMTHSTTALLKDEGEYVYLLTSMETPPRKWYLNCGEKPLTENPTKLSQILERNPSPKYNLSAKACQGILNRAERRGKELPQMLREALEKQSLSKNEPENQGGGKGLLIQEEKTGALACHPQMVLNDQGGDVMNVSDKAGTLRAQDHGHPPVVFGISPYDSNAMKSANPNSGFYRADTARTLDINGASPVCNQGGMAVVEPLLLESNQDHATVQKDGVCTTLPASMGGGGGYVPMVVEGADLYNQELTGDVAATMNASSCGSPTHSGPSVITYRKQSHPRNSEEPQGWEQTDKNDTLNVHDNSEVRTPTLVVYDARGNGNGETVPTITGDHENRVTDYSALAVQEDHYMTMQAIGEYKDCGVSSPVKARDCKEATDLVVKCIGNGQVHDAQNPEDVCKTLNCMADPMKIVMSDAKCIGNGQVDQAGLHEKVGALNCMHDQQAVLCFSDVAATRVARDGRSGFHTQAIDHPEENVVVGVDMYNQSLTGDQSKPLTAIATDSDHVPCLRTRDYNGVGTIVRRLTPLECTRLQSFPDGWVDIGDWVDSKGKLHKDADSPKYKALGNSIALCWWQWLAYNVAAELKSSGAEMKLASLFDGIGGFDLVFQNAGVEPVWASEIEEFPMAVTKIRFQEREVNGND